MILLKPAVYLNWPRTILFQTHKRAGQGSVTGYSTGYSNNFEEKRALLTMHQIVWRRAAHRHSCLHLTFPRTWLGAL